MQNTERVLKSFSTSSLSHNFENFPVISYSVSSKSKSLKKTVQEKYHTGNHGYLVHSVVFNKWLMSESLLNLLLHPGLLSRSGLGLLESFHCNQQPTCCLRIHNLDQNPLELTVLAPPTWNSSKEMWCHYTTVLVFALEVSQLIHSKLFVKMSQV